MVFDDEMSLLMLMDLINARDIAIWITKDSWDSGFSSFISASSVSFHLWATLVCM
jgi:hypothetical protein